MSFLSGWSQISFKQLVTISGDSKFLRSFKTISGRLLEEGDTTFLFCCSLSPWYCSLLWYQVYLPLRSSLNTTLPFCGFKANLSPATCCLDFTSIMQTFYKTHPATATGFVNPSLINRWSVDNCCKQFVTTLSFSTTNWLLDNKLSTTTCNDRKKILQLLALV